MSPYQTISRYDFGPTDEFAVCLWAFIPDEPGSGEYDLVEKWDHNESRYPFGIRYVCSSQKIYFERYDGTSATTTISNPITLGRFFHIAGVKEAV
jgi:hypothetical protein